MDCLLGIDIGGTNVKIGLIRTGDAFAVLKKISIPTNATDPAEKMVQRIAEATKKLLAETGERAMGVGVGCPGLIDPKSGTVKKSPNLPHLPHFPLCDNLQTQLGLDVEIQNDANAAALGEFLFGPSKGINNLILLTLGTGVGGAILLDGQLVLGATGKAGHWGHLVLDPDGAKSPVTGVPGVLEDAIGNCTVEARTGGRFRDTRALVDAHLAGDAEATRAWMLSVHRLAAGIASIVNAVDPEAVVIGGGIARAGAALFDPLRRFLDEMEWRPIGRGVELRPAALGDEAGAIGAARGVLGDGGGGGGPQERYLDAARGIVGAVAAQKGAIAQAADWFSAAILAGRMVHVFGAGHSRIMV